MARSPNNLANVQHRKMLYMLLVYLFAGAVACAILVVTPFTTGILLAPFVAIGLAWLLSRVVNKLVHVRCPVCDADALKENFTLQCRMPEYQCEQCQRRYVG